MNVVVGWPPNRAAIERAIGAAPEHAVYAWGDTIYSPSGDDLADHLVEHERTHSRQQAEIGGPETWWQRYLTDRDFRLDQEVEAYRAQLAFVQSAHRKRLLLKLAGDLSGPLYGRLISFGEAVRLLAAHT